MGWSSFYEIAIINTINLPLCPHAPPVNLDISHNQDLVLQDELRCMIRYNIKSNLKIHPWPCFEGLASFGDLDAYCSDLES
jgi:hypothetical protein